MDAATQTVDKSSGSVYSWLKTVPASDNNFQEQLKSADLATIQAVLADLPQKNSVTKRNLLESRLKQLSKKVLRNDLQKQKEIFESEGWEFSQIPSTGQWQAVKNDVYLQEFERIEQIFSEIDKQNNSEDFTDSFRVVEVDPARLNSGDIYKSDSMMLISDGKIAKPFEFEGNFYVWTGVIGGAGNGWSEVDAYRVIPKSEFSGKIWSYSEKAGLPFEERIAYPGFYHGLAAKKGQEEFILVGPKLIFKPFKPKPKSDPVSPKQAYDEIDIHHIMPSDSKPQKERRKDFTDENIAEMADSILTEGIIQPVLLRPLADGFELVAGERRWRGALKVGLEKIPAVIRNLTNEQVIRLQLHENLKRKDSHPLIQAFTYDFMMEEQGKSLEEIADEAGEKITHIAKVKRLVRLCDKVKDIYRRNEITFSHALEIAKYNTEVEQLKILELAFNNFGYASQALYPVSKFIKNIETYYLLRLDKASFSLNATNLGNVACVKCHQRTSAEPLLWENYINEKDCCSNPKCYEAKTQADKELKEVKQIPSVTIESEKPQTKAAIIKDEANSKPNQTDKIEETENSKKTALKNKNARFDLEIFDAVRLRVAKKAAAMVSDNVPGTDSPVFRRIVARMWELQCDLNDSITHRIAEWIGLDSDSFPCHAGVEFSKHFKQISNLSSDLCRKLWFLLMFETYRTQSEVMDLCDEKGIDYIILDAEERLASVPMEKKDEFRYYLHQLESGNRTATMPKRYL